ncbi:DUF742 domain-containing protein [Actinoallomurus rhizosphaericola]|uniref:DUF742 domain-containing protein n=1 Tax=Actinoallomurus rhizosphaericola TaxID=2952536 RepID=UPI0020916F7B|nr:DUF742 domain-containing protein [Actinoallomurus rhizosphaericola]MCO5993410.1 DUF742 domain-containing protein [Actinoallomurus rhizosphaericola]
MDGGRYGDRDFGGYHGPGSGPNHNPPPGPPPQPSDTGQSSSLVRPYAVTGGRTKPRYDLPIEALISAAPYPRRDITTLTPEFKAILDLCRNWRSVAEVSALLRLPLGVARVLIADMTHEGLVRVHQSPFTEGQPDLQLLERVLVGLRKL